MFTFNQINVTDRDSHWICARERAGPLSPCVISARVYTGSLRWYIHARSSTILTSLLFVSISGKEAYYASRCDELNNQMLIWQF